MQLDMHRQLSNGGISKLRFVFMYSLYEYVNTVWYWRHTFQHTSITFRGKIQINKLDFFLRSCDPAS